MGLSLVHSRGCAGVEAPLITVEVHLAAGLPSMHMVGLPETSVRESKDRVRAALINSGFKWPQSRITISLAPAELPKDGGGFDLPIALGVLAASKQIPGNALDDCEFLGELSLNGELRSVRGVLPAAIRSRDSDRTLIIPTVNAAEAALVRGGEKYCGASLLAIANWLKGSQQLKRCEPQSPGKPPRLPDLRDVIGLPGPKRALEVAAAGSHHLLMSGPPGTGKTLLASRLPGILPPMTEQESLETAALASVSQAGLDYRKWGIRPFRTPHHSCSSVALAGGGTRPRPGEISLAHNGVLFLDELPEYGRHTLEILREPIESGRIVISRAARQATFHARFQLVTAMNPCPCGMSGDDSGRCNCSAEQIQRYRSRISGLLLDRIDIQKGFGEFSITDLKTNEFLGRAGFAELNNGEIEVGYLLLKEYWGKGIASEALSTLLGWAGKALSVPRILAFTPINHHASIGVMKKAGMRYLKTESSHGVECIFYEYLLKPRDTPAKF